MGNELPLCKNCTHGQAIDKTKDNRPRRMCDRVNSVAMNEREIGECGVNGQFYEPLMKG